MAEEIAVCQEEDLCPVLSFKNPWNLLLLMELALFRVIESLITGDLQAVVDWNVTMKTQALFEDLT